MSSEVAIKVEGLSKCFHIYDAPQERLKQFVVPKFRRLFGLSAKKHYREFWALKDLSFEIAAGETVGIVGKNGSGKSTLLQIICDTLSATSGQVAVRGRIAALLELGSGFNPEFTGAENVYMNGAVMGLSRAEIDRRFNDIADFAEIGQFIDQPVKTYSSGMVIRLAFAIAINVDPQILIVDEALSVGDELFQRKCFSRIEAIKKSGATILFVSHSGSTIVELCDRALLLDSGELLRTGTPKEIVGLYQKLLYAPGDARANVRQRIRDGMPLVEPTTQQLKPETPDSESDQDFDPHLKPTSTINYESNGAVINSIAIRSEAGKLVNNLTMHGIYRYSYRVSFTKTVTNVRFGMLIKTTSGVELGGAHSANNLQESVPIIEKDQVYCVTFTFACHLNPGTYFMNAGVTGSVDGSDIYLHRMLDVVMFRVLPESDNLGTAIVNFGFVPEVECLV